MSHRRGISVVMTTYNGARYVKEQLDSILAQTLKPLEILIGDDGSTDGTVEIIKEIASGTDVPVQLTVNPERLGYVENFLNMTLHAQGDLIAFADQDDVWLAGKLAAAREALSSKRNTLWVSGWRLADQNLDPLPDRRIHTGFAQRSALAYPLHVPHGARAVFRRELLDYFPVRERARSVFGEQPAHHDEWIMFAACTLGRVATSSTPTMLYRRHPAAVSFESSLPSRRDLLNKQDTESSDDKVLAAAKDRARYLVDRATAPECQPVRAQMIAAADYYRRLIPKLTRRTTTQTAPRRGTRASSLLGGVLRGDYGRLAKGGLGLWILLQDSYALTR